MTPCATPPCAITPLEHPGRTAECWFINAVHDRAVDLYPNYARRPALTEVAPLECAQVLRLDGSPGQPFQTHSLAVRWAEHAGGPVLAEASMELQAGRSYTAVFHPGDVPGRYRLSVYRNDFRPGGRAGLEVRHVGFGPAVDWSLAPRRGTDITIPTDQRGGRLLRGQWQQAREVIENDYRLEARVQGRTTAVLARLALTHEVVTVAHYVGRAPSERRAQGGRAGAWLIQQLRVPAGAPEQPSVSHPAAPASAANSDRRIIFCAPPLEVVHTNAVSTVIEARDPDGRVAGLSIDRIDPDTGGIAMPAAGIVPSPAIGVPAVATLQIASGVPEGRYRVRIRANPAEGRAESATFTVPLTVRPVTLRRLRGRLDQLQAQGALEADAARRLRGLLSVAGTAARRGDAPALAVPVRQAGALLEAEAGRGIAPAAARDLARELSAFERSITGLAPAHSTVKA